MALAKARQAMLISEGKGAVELTLEQKILALATIPPLTEEEETALQAATVAGGDWGATFVYGQMLSQQAWCALIGRVPEMRPCWLRGYERREIICCPFAGLVVTDDPDVLCVGQAITGLMPWERRVLDSIIDDGFEMFSTTIQPLDDPGVDIDCTSYRWRQEQFPDAVGPEDWSQLNFNCEHEEQFTGLCSDRLCEYKDSLVSDEELKQRALARRRGQTGYESDPEEKDEGENSNPDA